MCHLIAILAALDKFLLSSLVVVNFDIFIVLYTLVLLSELAFHSCTVEMRHYAFELLYNFENV